MEYNVGAIIVACLIVLLAIIALIVATIGTIVTYYVEESYADLAKKIIPNKLNTVFGYNGRVFTIEKFNSDSTYINNIEVRKNAIMMLEDKTYLCNNIQKGGSYSYFLLCDIYQKLFKFGNMPENKGLYVIHNVLSKRHGCPALFSIKNSAKEKYYLATL